MKLYEECKACSGHGYRMPVAARPVGDNPPRTEWCSACDRRGYTLTADAVAIINLIQRHGADAVSFREPSADAG